MSIQLCSFTLHSLGTGQKRCKRRIWEGQSFVTSAQKESHGNDISRKSIQDFQREIPSIQIMVEEYLKDGNKLNRCILFVGDKKFGADLDSILAGDLTLQISGHSSKERRMIPLKFFAMGRTNDTPEGLDSLIACERISEGLDIKSVDTIILSALITVV